MSKRVVFLTEESDGVQLLEHPDEDGTQLITGRIPDDLPAFGRAVLEVVG